MRVLRLWLGSVGLVSFLRPRWFLGLHARIQLLGFRNTDDVEPSRALVVCTRLGGLLALVVGLRGLPGLGSRDSAGTDEIDFV
ncbi:MAG: hypothetical protein ABEJ35_02380 [Halobacteriaceae archaeon]